jgi:hypothetical protein
VRAEFVRDVMGPLTDRDIAVRAVADGAGPPTVGALWVCTRDPVMVGPDERLSVRCRDRVTV